MLSAQAYSFHQKSKLAISLSWISGYTNVNALLTCGVVISHVTGNFTWAARDLSDSVIHQDRVALLSAAMYGGLIVAFGIGAVLSAFMTETAKRVGFRSKYIVPIAAEALLLILFGVASHYHPINAPDNQMFERMMLGGILAMAMGIQNATITMISGSVVRTTHLTGVLTDLGLETVQYIYWYFDKMRSSGISWERQNRILIVSRRHPTFLRLALLSSIIGSFVLGVAIGCLVFRFLPNYSLIMPVSFLAFLVFMDWFKPIADVREMDVLSDPDLKIAGLVHELLPPQVGLFRMTTGAKHGGESRAPNFQEWVDHIPQHHLVMILALTPLVQFDDNSVLDLEQALNTLENRGKKLILCGINQKAYGVLSHHGIIERMGAFNVCVDVEDALVRGLALMEDVSPQAPPTGGSANGGPEPQASHTSPA